MNVQELEFQNIYDTYQPRILRYLVRLVGETEAEDVTQEVFVKVSQALKTFRGESQLPHGCIALPPMPPSIKCGPRLSDKRPNSSGWMTRLKRNIKRRG